LEIRGTHTGTYYGLNGVNCRPGFHYEWLNRNPNNLITSRIKGFEIVRAGDDDAPACVAALQELQDESDTPTPLDTSHIFQDIVYARIPEEKLRALKEEDAARARNMLRGGASAFVAGASPEELATDSEGRPTRFARRGRYGSHSLQFKDEQGQTEDTWVPERGIVERGK
jgi:hypothetical protein